MKSQSLSGFQLHAREPRASRNQGGWRTRSFSSSVFALLLMLSSTPCLLAGTVQPTPPPPQPPPTVSQPVAPSVLTINPAQAVRGGVVSVSLAGAPKDAKEAQVSLDGKVVPAAKTDAAGTFQVTVPSTTDPHDVSFVPLGKHRVALVVDGKWFTGDAMLDVERQEPQPALSGISPAVLVRGGERTLTLTGSHFAASPADDNEILFDSLAMAAPVWDGCDSSKWKAEDRDKTHGAVDLGGSQITLCNVALPLKNSVEVNVRQGTRSTDSHLFLTVSSWARWQAAGMAIGVLLVCVLIVLGLAFFARKYQIGEGRYGMWSILFLDLETDTFSLSKLQFYSWTAAAVVSYAYLVIGRFFVQKAGFPDVPGSLPGIIAIGAGTTIGAQLVTNVRGPKGGGPERPSLGDFVTSGGVAAPDRVQMLVWTIVGVVGFCAATFYVDPWDIKELPKIGDSLMLLMGISSAGYLGGKLARKPGPVLNEISVSPSSPDSGTGGASGATAPQANLAQPLAAAQQVFANASTAVGQQAVQSMSAAAQNAAHSGLAALKAAIDAATKPAADLFTTLSTQAAAADAASRVVAAEFRDAVANQAPAATAETTRQIAELMQGVASAIQTLAAGVSQAVGSAQAQAQISVGALPLRVIELRGRNLSADATFEISGQELPFRMLRRSDGTAGPQIVAPEDDNGATNMARALRLTIDPNALGPSDRATYDSWFKTEGQSLKVAICNPDGQMSEIAFTIPPGAQQAHN